MGWLISQNLTKQEQVDEIIRTYSSNEKTFSTLAHSVRGNVLFAVHQVTYPGKTEAFEDRFIGIYLLRKDRGAGWGYKAMDESMHPYQYSCPLSYLKEAPVRSEKWREGVRAFHEKQKQKQNRGKLIGPGTRFIFAPGFNSADGSLNGKEGQILGVHGRGYRARVGYANIKVMRRHIGEILTTE